MKPAKRALLVACLLTTSVLPSALVSQERAAPPPAPQPAPSATERELVRIAQELLDAIAPGDRAVWERHLDDACLYAAEDGRVLTKAQLLEELRPLPAAYEGSIKVTNPQAREHGDVAILTYDAMETLALYGQTLHTHFHATDTYRRRDGRWRLIATQVQVLPSELEPVAVDPKLFDAYAGTYELAADVAYVVTREGDKLMGQRTGRAKEELLPKGEASFFVRGQPRGEKVFQKDADGRVVRLVDRRDNNDLVWKRVR